MSESRSSGVSLLWTPCTEREPQVDIAVRPKAEIRCGDAYDLAASVLNESIDLILTSPPYWGHRNYGQEHNWELAKEWKSRGETQGSIPSYDWYRKHGGVLGLEPYPDWYVAHLREIFALLKPKLKPSGSLWINIGDTYFARWSSIRPEGRQGLSDGKRLRRKTPMGGYLQEKQLLLIPSRFAIEMQSHDWILRNDLIWYKPNVPPRPEKDRLRLAHEHFFHFVKRPKIGRAKYFYDMNQVEERGTDVVVLNAKGGENGHSATFPESLIRPRILSSCPDKGTVLDPFCGTGRTLTVARDSGRHSIGFELCHDYVKTANISLRGSKVNGAKTKR